MKNKNLKKELSKKLNSEEITLPESLSAEKIESLINEKGKILSPKRPKTVTGAKVVKIFASAAAVVMLVIGLTAVIGTLDTPIEEEKQDEIIENELAQSDYSEIEAVILDYYKNIYNYYNSERSDSDSLLEGIQDFFYDNVQDTAQNGSSIIVQNEESAVTHSVTSSSSSLGTTGTDESTENYSTTNTQVSGVDEADIIKNDGRYIYYLHDNEVIITDCYEPDSMNIVSRIEYIGTYASEMYLYDDKIILIGNEEREFSESSKASIGEYSDCLYYQVFYDTIITVYDISDKEKPELEYTYVFDGSYVSSRITDGKLIVVSNYEIPYYSVDCTDFEEGCEAVKGIGIPTYSVNDGETSRISSDRVTIFSEENPTAYIVTALIKLDDLNDEPKLNAYLGCGYEIYCTADELFIASCESSYWTVDEKCVVADDNGEEFNVVTRIYKLDIKEEGVIYNTQAVVGGQWLNQFSMDKYGNYFRIVTNGSKYNEDIATFVYVLNNDMHIVGYLEDIAVSEQMKSARFMGDTLYLVTFYQTDPLFIIDLSAPTAPEIKGELKIPGFSSYLHPIGENLVIGVGEGGTVNGTDGSAKVSLFDVSDPYNPKEIDNYTVADAYFDSNHKSFMAVDDDTFALCLTSYHHLTNSYVRDFTVVMFDIAENGITVQGTYNTFSWSTGMENTGSLRGVFIDDSIFAVNGIGIMSYSMTTNELLGELKF